MKRLMIILLSVVFSLIYCEGTTTGPSPPSTSTTSIPQDPPPPVINPGLDFSWENSRGVLAFPAYQLNEAELQIRHNRMKQAGWPTIIWHICSEVVEWDHTRWDDDPRGVFSPDRLSDVRRFLNSTAEMGDLVLLDIFCTIRDNSKWMFTETTRQVEGKTYEGENWMIYTEVIGKIIRDYNHIAVHVANEHWHQGSALRDVDRLKTVKNKLREINFQGLIGTDDNSGGPGDFIYNPDLRALGFWPDLHPYRNPDPTPQAVQRMVNTNGGFLVISEPTAWSDEYGDEGCCTSSRAKINAYARACESITNGECIWFYHSTCGLDNSVCDFYPPYP